MQAVVQAVPWQVISANQRDSVEYKIVSHVGLLSELALYARLLYYMVRYRPTSTAYRDTNLKKYTFLNLCQLIYDVCPTSTYIDSGAVYKYIYYEYRTIVHIRNENKKKAKKYTSPQ